MRGVRGLAELLLVLALMAASAALYTSWAMRLTQDDLSRGGRGYVSDEVWYVSAARNLVVKVFGMVPKPYNGTYGCTVIYSGALDVQRLNQLSRELGVQLRTDYTKLNGFYASSTSKEALLSFLGEVKKIVNVVDVVPGWMLPDAEGINNYLNTEHPPAAKYIIGLEIALLGDYPLLWRVGSIAAGTLTVLFAYLASKRLFRGDARVALATSALIAVDPVMRNMASVALLDVYVALFTAASMWLALGRRYRASAAVVLAGSAFKFTALFALIPLSVLYARDRCRGSFSLAGLAQALAEFYAVSALGFLAVQALVSIPLIEYLGFFGPGGWLKQSIVGAIAWHTQVKCVGPGCAPSSAPWDWFFGTNSFPLYYFSSGEGMYASGFWPLWSFALAGALLVLPMYTVDEKFAKSALWLCGTTSGYVLLWIVGGRTQYSFYSVQLEPFVYMVVAALAYAAAKPDVLVSRFVAWKKLYYAAEKVVSRLLLIERGAAGKTG